MKSPLLRKLKTASSFSPSDWKLLLEAAFLFFQMRLWLLVAPHRIVAQALSLNDVEHPRRICPLSQEQLTSLFYIAWRYQWPEPKCLLTALARHLLLRRYGFASQLRIGVQKEGKALKAHTWCEGAEEEPTQWHPLVLSGGKRS